MARLHSCRLVAKNRWLSLGCFCLFALALALALTASLAWTSGAPALTLPTLTSQAQPTFDAGFYHSLALKSDGSLWTWGYNISGQLGKGTPGDLDVPTRIGTSSD
ncbi:MAG: hypothetical protein JW990_10380, partial [Thermoleophilia bacterium]|nr:hypothetical protein [Thermoleophilia bacterium]